MASCEIPFLLPLGVLAHLEKLETQVNRSRKKLEEPQGAQAVESSLGTKIRDKLRSEVKQRQARVSRSVIVGRRSFLGCKEHDLGISKFVYCVLLVILLDRFQSLIPQKMKPVATQLISISANNCQTLLMAQASSS